MGKLREHFNCCKKVSRFTLKGYIYISVRKYLKPTILSKQQTDYFKKFHDGIRHMATRQRDRKSTRLNSSHVSISYAVFCLKKKRTRYCKWKRRNLIRL